MAKANRTVKLSGFLFGFGVVVGFLASLKNSPLVNIHELAVVVYGLKNGCVVEFFFNSACANGVNLFFGGTGKDLEDFFFALGTEVGSVDQLLGVFD
jgi:hypothetical protein